jgi:hypothetical protein
MNQMRISTSQVSSVMLRSKELEIQKKSENCKSRRMKTKQSAMKLAPYYTIHAYEADMSDSSGYIK